MAGNYCDSCQKMVSFETGDPEEQGDVDVAADGEGGCSVTADVHVPRNCADCGTELKYTDLNLTAEVAADEFSRKGEGTVTFQGHGDDCEADDFDAEVEWNVDEQYNTTDRNGKPIKRARYQRLDIIVRGEGTVTCNGCQATATFTLEEAVSAGSFDEA